MKKFLLSMVALLGMSLAASAADATFNNTTLTNGAGGDLIGETFTENGVTIKFVAGDGDYRTYNAGAHIRFYQGESIEVTTTEPITKIVCTTVANSKGAFEVKQNNAAIGTIDGTGVGAGSFTWTGSATGTFTLFATKQVRFSSIVFTTGEGGGSVDPTPDDPVGDDIYASDFSNGASGFTYEDGTLPEGLTYVWTVDKSYGYLKASAYVKGVNYAAESYAVSPVLDLTKRQNATLTFSHVMNFFTSIDVAKTETGLFVREEGTTNWTKLEFTNYPTALGWKPWIENTIDLSAYVGKKIQLGFWYKSTEAKSGTWEVKDVKVVGKASTGIADITVDENAPVEYYNLQGVRVANPENGLYIRRQGNKTTKVLVK